MKFDVIPATWEKDRVTLKQLRDKVFIEEQGVEPSIEQDGQDQLNTTAHFLGLLDEKPIAAGRILGNGKIGRVCVLDEYRNKGFGEKITRAMVFHTLEQGKQIQPFLHAQEPAIAFYQRCGFRQDGEQFFEANIAHRLMRFELRDASALEWAYQDKVLRLQEADEFSRHIAQIVNASRRQIAIYSHALDENIYTTSVVDACSKFARSNRQAEIRVLIENTKQLASSGHPFITLGQRLPSSISLRKPTAIPIKEQTAYLIADHRHLVYFNDEKGMLGFVNYQAKAEASHQLEEFNQMWRYHSEEDQNLSRLAI